MFDGKKKVRPKNDTENDIDEDKIYSINMNRKKSLKDVMILRENSTRRAFPSTKSLLRK